MKYRDKMSRSSYCPKKRCFAQSPFRLSSLSHKHKANMSTIWIMYGDYNRRGKMIFHGMYVRQKRKPLFNLYLLCEDVDMKDMAEKILGHISPVEALQSGEES